MQCLPPKTILFEQISSQDLSCNRTWTNLTCTWQVTSLIPMCSISSFSCVGECVLQRAVMVRKKLTAREGRGWLSGTLFVTHFRVAFVPQDSHIPDVSLSHEWLKHILQEKNNVFKLYCWYILHGLLMMQDNADPVLLGDHDVALASIEKVVVGK